MNWLNPKEIRSTEEDPEADAEANVSAFLERNGSLGRITLEALEKIAPFHCYMPDEYLSYAERFIESACGYIPSEYANCPDLVEELVRRSFYPAQVCFNTSLDGYWVTPEDIKTIARLITERIEQLGGIEQLYPS